MIGEQVAHDEMPGDYEEDIDTDESTAESGHESDGCV